MTRRDRAALVLAYECVRQRCGAVPGRPHWTWTYKDVLEMAREALDLGDSGTDALAATLVYMSDWRHYDRVLRARLALLLRALIRADAGDFGRTWCVPCGEHNPAGCECWDEGRDLGPRSRRITPLWTLARKDTTR